VAVFPSDVSVVFEVTMKLNVHNEINLVKLSCKLEQHDPLHGRPIEERAHVVPRI
jgi:hypothetical protein